MNRKNARGRDGNLSVIFALALFPIVAMIFLSFDVGRVGSARSEMQHLSDLAALAAANMDNPMAPQEVAEVYLLKSGRFDPERMTVTTKVDESISHREVTVNAEYTIPATVSLEGTPTEYRIRTSATAMEARRNIEIALALDISSSMNGKRIAELRQVTERFIDTIFANSLDDATSMSLIPFGGNVNLADVLPYYYAISPNWNGCIDKPAALLDDETFQLDDATLSSHYLVWNKHTNYWCPKDDARAKFNSDDAEMLKSEVKGWKLSDGTGTDIGASWAYRALSPQWRGKLGGDFDARPADWNDEKTQKIMLVMTDGGVTGQWRPTTYTESLVRVPINDANGEWLYNGHAARQALLSICEKAKQKDVIVFSIAFDVPNANQRKVMEDCANKGNYFEADEKELESVFDNIAYRISELRLIR